MFRKKKESYDYFDAFEEIARMGIQATELLSKILSDYSLETLEEQRLQMHELEHGADEKKHHMMRYLYQDFLPPIERDDIIQLAHALDTTLDMIEEIVIRLDMYQLPVIKPEMEQFLELIRTAAEKAHEILRHLREFKKNRASLRATVEMSDIEEQGDELHQHATKQLYREGGDLLQAYGYSKVYDAFERCCDAYEDVADIVEALILKNS